MPPVKSGILVRLRIWEPTIPIFHKPWINTPNRLYNLDQTIRTTAYKVVRFPEVSGAPLYMNQKS